MGATRRVWSVDEKIAALDYYRATGSKKRTVRDLDIPCTKMLREWLQSESLLRAVSFTLGPSLRVIKKRRIGTGFFPHTQTAATRAADAELPGRRFVASNPSNLQVARAQVARALVDAINKPDSISLADDNDDISVYTEAPGCRCIGCRGRCVQRRRRHGSMNQGTDGDAFASENDDDGDAGKEVELDDNSDADGGARESDSGAVTGNSVGTSGDSVPAELASLLPKAGLQDMIDAWLKEDCPGFDYGGAVVGSRIVSAKLFAKSPGVLAGLPFFTGVFDSLGCSVTWERGIREGQALEVSVGDRMPLATVRGRASAVLQGERVALNALAECSGVATVAARMVGLARCAGWSGRLAGTRKTTPGFRAVQKYGMIVGGMDTHRMDLSGMVMLKDNHVAAAGGIAGAVEAARRIAGFSLKIDVECSSVSDALEAGAAGADVVMLDNMDPREFREAASRVRTEYPTVLIEGSGGITPQTLCDYFCDDADVLSFSVSRYAHPLDMSLKVQTF